MSLQMQVASTTMFADLDEALRSLLQRGLREHGIDRVDIAFDAPDKEWSGQLSTPTLNVFLYDLRESTVLRQRGIDERRTADGAVQSRPPLRLDCSYSISAWANDVEDEHRLLSQALAILFAFPRLPEEVLPMRLRDGSQRYPLFTRIGQPREGKADFWGSVGGQYKASLDYVVTLTVEPGAVVPRGPEVRSQVVRVGDIDGPRGGAGAVTELHRIAGQVVDADGAPVAGAWVALADLGRLAATDEVGRYRFDAMPPGDHTVSARTDDGATAELNVSVPGANTTNLVVKRRAAARRTARIEQA